MSFPKTAKINGEEILILGPVVKATRQGIETSHTDFDAEFHGTIVQVNICDLDIELSPEDLQRFDDTLDDVKQMWNRLIK